MTRIFYWAIFASCLALLSPNAGAEEKPLTAKVIKGDLPIQVELSGVFIAENKDEIAMEPKEYRGDLIVTTLLPEGSEVKKGDVLMEFDKESLSRSLEEATDKATDAEVELKKANAELQAQMIEKESKVKGLERELVLAEKALEGAQEKASMELEEKSRTVDSAEKRLADGKIDYQQLIELYQERELHTETETILIEREKRSIIDLEYALEKTKKELAHYKKYEHLRDAEEKDIEVEKKRAELKKATVQSDADLAEKEAAAKKAERSLEKASKEKGELTHDQETLLVTSPRDGVLFYGTTDNELPAGLMVFGNQNNEMRIGGRVRTHDILMTVATMDQLAIKMRVLENDIQHMKQGLPITVTPDAFPNLSLKGELTKVDQIASREGILSEVREFTVKGTYEGIHEQLRSGMNCRVTVHADNVPDAIQVPVVAVFEDGGKFSCFVDDGGKSRKQEIKIGTSNGKMVQIKEGLKPGQTIYLYDPNKAE